MAAKLTFHRPTSDDLKHIADNMWHEDRRELAAGGNTDILQCLIESVESSKVSVVAKHNGNPLVIYGLQRFNMLGRKGIPWMLTTVDSKNYRREFMVYTRKVIDEMLTECPYLYNYVHTKNKTSIKWLTALGFTIDDPVQHVETGELFHLFHIGDEHV